MSRRLLHVVRSLRPETGGPAEAVRNLAVVQRRRGDAVQIVSLDLADEGDAAAAFDGRGTYGYAPGFPAWLRRRHREFDAVVVHGLWQYHAFGTWRALRGTTTPYLVYCHGMLDPWFKRAHPLKHLKKWLYWPWADYRVLRDAAAVCFTAEAERRKAQESFWLYRARECIAPLGIEATRGDAERERAAFHSVYPALRDRRFLLFLSRIHPKKGIDLLLRGYAEVMAGYEDAPRLVIAGPSADGGYRRSLEAQAVRLGIAHSLEWLPMLTGEAKWGALRACEAFVLFSHQENFGMAVVEALACGCPVLISDCIDISAEIALDGAGIVVPDTPQGVRDAMARWRTSAAVDRHAMSRAATACFERRYKIERAVAVLDGIIDALPS